MFLSFSPVKSWHFSRGIALGVDKNIPIFLHLGGWILEYLPPAKLTFYNWANFLTISSAFRCVYRKSILGSLWPDIVATSTRLNPASKKRLIASWRRSWNFKSLTFARTFNLSHASLKALAFIGKGFGRFRFDWDDSMSIAFGESGTSRLVPFLVSGSRAVCLFKSINCHSRHQMPLNRITAINCHSRPRNGI